MTESMDDWGFELHALYRIYDPFGRPLYFGETDDLPRRLRQHMEKAWFRRPEITIKVTWFPNRAEALAAETAAIAAEKPWHNKAGLQPEEKAPKKARLVAAQPPNPEPRDLLTDIDHLLGDERVRLSRLSQMLRQLAPEWEPYEKLNGVLLAGELKARGVRWLKTAGLPCLDPADLRVILKKAG